MPDGVWDVIAPVCFILFLLPTLAAPGHPELKFVICAIVVYTDVWVSASDVRLFKFHCAG
jgi:hypothetical protein